MAEVKRYKITEPYLDLGCGLGEAPFWEKSRNSLRFVDIHKKRLHTINLSEGPSSHKELNLEYPISTTADIEGNDNEFVFGGKYGYGIMHRETGKVRSLKMMWDDSDRKVDPEVDKTREERMRSNDGAVDSMDDDTVTGKNYASEGVLFRLDNDLTLHRMLEGLTIPNGTSWSRDNKTMYFTDSPSGRIDAYPYDPEKGEMSTDQGRPFFTVDGGVPDGHCQDEEGCLWVAGHSTGKVFRVSPQGQLLAEIELPTRCVTCPAFCGTELFITSMTEQKPEEYPWSTKYQGGLFKIDVGVHGSPLNRFKMTAGA